MLLRLKGLFIVLAFTNPLMGAPYVVEGLPFKTKSGVVSDQSTSEVAKDSSPNQSSSVPVYYCRGSSIQEEIKKDNLVTSLPRVDYQKVFVLRFTAGDQLLVGWEPVVKKTGVQVSHLRLNCKRDQVFSRCLVARFQEVRIPTNLLRNKLMSFRVKEELTINHQTGYIVQESSVTNLNDQSLLQGKFHGFCQVQQENR
jgi:hypothetical protein